MTGANGHVLWLVCCKKVPCNQLAGALLGLKTCSLAGHLMLWGAMNLASWLPGTLVPPVWQRYELPTWKLTLICPSLITRYIEQAWEKILLCASIGQHYKSNEPFGVCSSSLFDPWSWDGPKFVLVWPRSSTCIQMWWTNKNRVGAPMMCSSWLMVYCLQRWSARLPLYIGGIR